MAKKKTVCILCAAAVIILFWAVFLPLVTSNNLRMDSERMIHHPEIALNQYTREGRIALGWLLQLLGLNRWNPVLSGILWLSFMTCGGLLLYAYLKKMAGWNQPSLYILFSLLYMLSPIWAFHGYFVLQIAPIGLGMVMTTLLAGEDMLLASGMRKLSPALRACREAAAAALLCLPVLIYQALIVHYLTLAAVFLFCHALRGRKVSPRALLVIALRLLVCLAVYSIVSRVARAGADAANLEGQIHWGRDSLLHCLFRIIQEAGATVLMYGSRFFSLYTPGIVLGCILCVRRWKEPGRSRESRLLLAASGIGLLLLPFAMAIFLGNVTVPRAQFALQLVGAFLPVCFLAETGGRSRILRAVCLVAAALQVLLVIRLIHTDNVRNELDVTAGKRISAGLDACSPEKPIVFIGVLQPEQSLLTEKTDVFGRSFFEWIYTEENPASAGVPAGRLLSALTGREYNIVFDGEIIPAALEAAGTMPVYPDSGFIAETVSFTVVHLSDV